MQATRRRQYVVTTLLLFSSSYLLHTVDWQGSANFHTILEAIATLLAFFVGVLALIRYQVLEEAKFLYIGAGFLGTSFLDAYHTIVTSAHFSTLMPSAYSNLVPWSWSASRIFLSLLMCVSWWLWFKNRGLAHQVANPQRIFWITSVATLGCFLLFTVSPLPSITISSAFVHRPFELLAALFFLIALIGYLYKGMWRDDDFEHWLVLSLIVGFATQAIFMLVSDQLHDTAFNVAHLLKKLSYVLVLTGLLVSIYNTYIALRLETQQRAQFEKELQATVLYTRSLIEASLDPLVTISPAGKVTDANLATEKVTGLGREQLIGSDFSDYFTEPEKAHAGYQQVFSMGKVTAYPLVIRHLSGALTDVLYNASVYRDQQGNVAGVFASARDITKQKAAELELRLLSTAIEQSPTSVVITNLNAEVEYVNPRFTREAGYSFDEVRGKNPRVLQSGLTDPSVYIAMWDALTKGQSWVGEFVNKRKSGEVYYEEAYISPVLADGDNATHYVAVKLDVTARKEAQTALRESHQRVHTLLNSMAEGAYGVDTQGNCTFVNQAFLRILGYDHADEVVGQHIHELTHYAHADGSHYPTSECRMYMAYQRHEGVHCVDEVFWRKDGMPIQVEYWSEPMMVDGVVVGAIATFMDITERKKMEDEIRQMAFYDVLTKLPNQRLLLDRLSQTITTVKRTGRHGVLMFLDLDNFKPLNDTHGHEAGDKLLIEAANRLTSCMREVDTVARVGGDEFVVILGALDKSKEISTIHAAMVAEKIRAALSAPYSFIISHANQPDTFVEHHCTGSIGIMVFNGKEGSQDDLMKWADTAMYEAKDAGRNQVKFYGEQA